jgi:hypothetical protein
MTNIHFSALDNVKMTCMTQVSLKINSRKSMFTLTFVDHENETSTSIWEFEKMKVLKYYSCILFSSLHDLIHRTEMKQVY